MPKISNRDKYLRQKAKKKASEALSSSFTLPPSPVEPVPSQDTDQNVFVVISNVEASGSNYARGISDLTVETFDSAFFNTTSTESNLLQPETEPRVDSEQHFDEAFLSQWALTYNISHASLHPLLKALKTHSCFSNFPNDARSLLKTQRGAVSTREVAPGRYVHFGVENAVLQCLKECSTFDNETIEVQIGIDGVPLFQSSNSAFWPILGRIPNQDRGTFIIGLYYGLNKPSDPNLYLEDFILEVVELYSTGIIINGTRFFFKIHSFVCDVPAKSFILSTKGHSGYSSCSKCITRGKYRENRVCFPEMNAPLRDHDSFISKTHAEYHTGSTNLLKIPGLDVVKHFPLDVLHLVYLGVCKKLLKDIWIHGNSPPAKLSHSQQNELSERLISLRPFIPSEFQRRPRGVSEIAHWKGSEYKFFILYAGPLVLKDFFDDNILIYHHFVRLTLAITILSSDLILSHLSAARTFLEKFVKDFKTIYGEHLVSHNIHNLLHLASDCENYGRLQNFSAFPFESAMKPLTALIRKGDKPLEQAAKRLREKSLVLVKSCLTVSDIQLGTNHQNGPLIEDFVDPQYRYVMHKNLKISSKRGDRCVLMDGDIFVLIVNICTSSEGIPTLLGHRLKFKNDLFVKPWPSSCVNICVVEKEKAIEPWPVKSIKRKCLCFPHGTNSFVTFPMVHC